MTTKVQAIKELGSALGVTVEGSTIAESIHSLVRGMGATDSKYSDEGTIAASIADLADAVEDGAISVGGAGNGLIVNYDNETYLLDKTWQEIHDALESMKVTIALSESAQLVTSATVNSNNEYVVFISQPGHEPYGMYVCNSANDYPSDE